MVRSPWRTRTLRFDDDRFDGLHGYERGFFCPAARAAGRRVVEDPSGFQRTRGGIGNGQDLWWPDAILRRRWRRRRLPMEQDPQMSPGARSSTFVERA